MTIRNRLTLLFTVIFATILLLFAIAVLYSYDNNRQDEFVKHLRQEASTKFSLLYDVKIPPEVLQSIYHNAPNALSNEEVAIYDTAFTLLYHDAVEIDFVKESRAMIDDIVRNNEIRFQQQDHQVIGFTVEKDGKTFVITAAAVDEYGLDKLAGLRNGLIISFVASILVTVLAGRFLSKQVLKPVSDMVEKVKEITATNLDLRVDEGNRKDEIAELAITFNEMLNRLESSFDAQKQFVSNISHELRTPLSAIIAELDLSTHRERGIMEYKAVINNAMIDARKLAKLSNSLLDFAKANYDTSEITFKLIRLDETLLDARQQVRKSNLEYQVGIQFENELSDEAASVRGNEYLLTTAFANLMENACKFSNDKRCDVLISFESQKAVLRFVDKGIGIAKEDQQLLFTPFYRGENKNYAEGNGIGLSLTQKIVALHSGAITLHSVERQGSTFTVEIPLSRNF